VPRERLCEELKDAIGCADVRWMASKRSDKAGKFRAEIEKADILLLLKNFAGHDMSKKGKEWVRGHYILIPSGYGLNQIVHQLFTYATTRKNGRQ
jgi:hypothetical protein